MTDQRQEILNGLRPMFEEARASGKWFWCNYQDLWFSPDDLQAQHDNGKFIWGAVNWKLRDPKEMVDAAQRRAEQARQDLERARESVQAKA